MNLKGKMVWIPSNTPIYHICYKNIAWKQTTKPQLGFIMENSEDGLSKLMLVKDLIQVFVNKKSMYMLPA